MKRFARAVGAALVAVTVTGGSVITPAAAMASQPNPVSTPAAAATTTGHAYPGDPAKEAALVAAESQRMYNLRAITDAARWRGIATNSPYLVTLGAIPTLVLVAQQQPYTVDELTTLIPSAFVRQPDGTYLLSDNIVVDTGGVLNISSPSGLTMHLSSSSKGFVSIITLGGALVIAGSAAAAVHIDGWDPTQGAADSNTSDGRSYLRVVGGTADISYADFDHLGFWSGGTGGLALTGTATTASDTAKSASPAPSPIPPPSFGKIRGAKIRAVKPVQATGTIGDVVSSVAGATGLYSYVTAKVSHVKINNDAYGLFVNGSKGVSISDCEVRGSLVDGIVFHRFVTNSTITTTTSNDNAVDGFAMTRASTGIVIKDFTADYNGRDGISLNGGALANGPNAAGTAVGNYGNNSLTGSTANGNARYGINVLGGSNVKVIGDKLEANSMGIVVTKAATNVTISGNSVVGSVKHGIALLGGVSRSSVLKNSIAGADIGIYLRDSNARVERNVISDVSNHGVTLIGTATGSLVLSNTVSGSGPSAIDAARASGVVVGANGQSHWTNTKPLSVVLASIFQPLTVLWILLGLIVVISALSGVGKKYSGFRHPYANLVPLVELTRGIVSPEELGLEGVIQSVATVRPAEFSQAQPHVSASVSAM